VFIFACAMICLVFGLRKYLYNRHRAPARAAAPIAAHVVAREETLAIASIKQEEEELAAFETVSSSLYKLVGSFARDDNGSSRKVGFECDYHQAPLPAAAARPTEMIF
jgi:hypothetical protein